MGNFFRAGGAGMYPTLIFGFVMMAAAVLYLLRPERRYLSLFVTSVIATTAAGTLGTVTGLLSVARYLAQAQEPDPLRVLIAGFAESLHCVMLAMILVMLSSIVALIAAGRVARAAPVAE